MKPHLLIFVLLLTISASAQTKITPSEAKDHIGETVEITGKVFGIRYLENAKNNPTFINVGGKFPNQLLTIVIWRDVRKKFTYDLSKKELASGMVTVTGKLVLFNGKPQVVVTDPAQLKFKFDEEIPLDKLQ